MVKRVDKTSKEAMKINKWVFRGKEGRAYRQSIVDFLRDVVPLTDAYTAGQTQVGNLGGYLQDAINAQRSVLPAAQQAVQQGLTGNFFDIAPYQQYAERELARNTIPNIANTFATAGTPLSSDTTGQITNATRDTYLDLAARDSLMEFQAKNGLINQGGLGDYMNAAQQPANLGFSGTTQLFGADLAARQATASGQPGASSLFPSYIQGGLMPLNQTETAGRAVEEV